MLQEVVVAVRGRLLLNIEVRTNSLRDDGLSVGVRRRVEENGLSDRAGLSCFIPVVSRRLRQLCPRILAGLLQSSRSSLFLRRRWHRAWVGPGAPHPRHAVIDHRLLKWARAQGYRVRVWTVKDAGDMRRAARLRVGATIISRPEILGQVTAGLEA